MFINIETMTQGIVILNKTLISSVMPNEVNDYVIKMSNGDTFTIHESDLEKLTKQL